MKIIIAGDGKVGATLTRQLTSEGYDVTIIDSKASPLESSVERYDVISVQGNCASMDVLRQAGAEVLGIASIFTYGMKKSVDRLAEANVKNVSLTDLDTVAQVAAAEGYIRPEDQQRLLKFRENPSDESWIQK